MKRLLFPSILISCLAGGAAMAADQLPTAVAPGGAEMFKVLASRCPTFHWGAPDEPLRVELVVYRLAGETDARAELAQLDPALRVVLPGTARGWTPSLAECLEPGGRYFWAVRALGVGKTSDWSAARLFQVATGPTLEEVNAAMEVLKRFTDSETKQVGRSQASDAGNDAGALVASPRPAAREESSALIEGLATVTGSAALWAETDTTSGENHGVVGITHSSEGVAVAAENAGGGPDVLLKGDASSVDLELTESGLDRPSDSDQTFEFTNSLAGTLTLEIDGVDVVTTATDQDALASLGCGPTQIARWTGSAWECSADLDSLGTLTCMPNQIAQWTGSAWECVDPTAGGGDTLAGLTCGSNQIVHWNGVAWVCGQPAVTHHTCSDTNIAADCTVNCPAGSFVWTGGCAVSAAGDYLVTNAPTGGASGPSGWRCQARDLFGGTAGVSGDLYCVAQ